MKIPTDKTVYIARGVVYQDMGNHSFAIKDFNSALEELFLSESAWIRWEGKTLPVIISSKDMTLKNVLNDKLIDYTVGFEFAFNKINNVR